MYSFEKRNRVFVHFQTSQTPYITLHGYYHDVIEQKVNFLIHYESDSDYIMLHMQWQRMRKELM